MFRVILLICTVVLLSNCVAVQTFPSAARAGDTITLAVGSVDGLNKNNLIVSYYPDDDQSNPIDITASVRSILKIFPDKTSKSYWDTSSGSGLETMTYLSALSLHGPWESVVVIDLPEILPVGFGIIKIGFGAGVISPVTLASANSVDIALEILPSPGNSNLFEYRKLAVNSDTNPGDLSKLEQTRQVVVKTLLPDFIIGTTAANVAAAEYTVTVPVVDQISTDVTNLLSDEDFAVVLDDQPSYIRNQTSLIWSRVGSEFKVIVLCPTGKQNVNQIRFSILLSNLTLSETNGWTLSENATLDLVAYYDETGNEITGTLPELLVQN